MCTAINWKAKEHYFGRNLDLDYSYKETITITPRNFPFLFRKMGQRKTHYAMIGVAYVVGAYPLYYDATTEMGVSMAGLMFSKNAFYPELQENRENISPLSLFHGYCHSVGICRRSESYFPVFVW